MERGVTAVERVRGSEHRERRIAWAADAAAAVALQAENWMCPHVRRRPSPFPDRESSARADNDRDACKPRSSGRDRNQRGHIFRGTRAALWRHRPRTPIPREVHPREDAVEDDINITSVDNVAKRN